jgi:hypothetical protein
MTAEQQSNFLWLKLINFRISAQYEGDCRRIEAFLTAQNCAIAGSRYRSVLESPERELALPKHTGGREEAIRLVDAT